MLWIINHGLPNVRDRMIFNINLPAKSFIFDNPFFVNGWNCFLTSDTIGSRKLCTIRTKLYSMNTKPNTNLHILLLYRLVAFRVFNTWVKIKKNSAREQSSHTLNQKGYHIFYRDESNGIRKSNVKRNI